MLAGSVALSIYLIAHALGTPTQLAWGLGLVFGGVAFGRVARLPSFRSPIVWRRSRR